MLKKYGYDKKSDMVYLQTFDFNELKRIKNELLPKMGMDLKLVQLVAYTDWHETEEKMRKAMGELRLRLDVQTRCNG